ncbi:flavodoxin family protein [Anaerocolumna sp.]|uniref:flavodoxin family protein n=1 Tax=Anaerocolumna sp. TaxID=2041569 RepID=UPI0028AC9D09|nr:flavodoxin family protein [Anaerocolumna sp.]
MKVILIKEISDIQIEGAYTLDLSKIEVNHCVGCWSCWWKNPGRCIYKDLNQYYHEYITADKVLYFAKVTKGFVTSNLKNLFDRMIPLYLPYTTYKTGESMHVKRYKKYPDIEFYYDGHFKTDDGCEIFENYINRVFYQFYSENIMVKPIEEFFRNRGNQK